MPVEPGEGATPSKENGGTGPNYVWTQTHPEAVVAVPVPVGTAGNMVHVEILQNRLVVGLKGADSMLVEGDLFKPIDPEESVWTVDPEEGLITVHLEKCAKMTWWSCVILGHEEIDVVQIPPRSDMLGVVETEMYNNRRNAR